MCLDQTASIPQPRPVHSFKSIKSPERAGESSPGRKPWVTTSSSPPSAVRSEGAREQVVCPPSPRALIPRPFRPQRSSFDLPILYPGLAPWAESTSPSGPAQTTSFCAKHTQPTFRSRPAFQFPNKKHLNSSPLAAPASLNKSAILACCCRGAGSGLRLLRDRE